MTHTSTILTGLLFGAMALFIAPNIFAMNRGRVLRNIALWMIIFLALGLFYKEFGPQSERPLFHTPASMVGMRPSMSGMHRPTAETPPQETPAPAPEKKDEPENGSTGLTPPKE
ncbi:MAG: hypothetical protein PHE27_02995 [Alphaproteobacteria bacterium]|nr:hypothetical protein [Alphaproteobacteria bacterium]